MKIFFYQRKYSFYSEIKMLEIRFLVFKKHFNLNKFNLYISQRLDNHETDNAI
jgi:hypothetical protein